MADDGPRPIDMACDRAGTFEPPLIVKHERRFTGFDDKILALRREMTFERCNVLRHGFLRP